MSEITGKSGQSLCLTAVAEQISPQIDRGCYPGLNKPKKKPVSMWLYSALNHSLCTFMQYLVNLVNKTLFIYVSVHLDDFV